MSCGLQGVSAQGPPKVGKRLTSELRLRPSVVRSAPRARDTRLGSVSAALMNVSRPIIPNWSTTMLAGILVTNPDHRIKIIKNRTCTKPPTPAKTMLSGDPIAIAFLRI